ncbi:EamA family transporter [Chitinispirillales bacterium ANBcel5]|uniref:EamA family transporter n=1 Tax=Cellulosispirillum alkaliphilum TaxID=3039283 RepID=UPI002A58230D|nr:EamA family transporter [Chitinispirillales bacterium ANBcel5]
MRFLLFVTFLWAFSFSLIDNYLGEVDSYFAVLSRVVIAGSAMLPFTQIRGVHKELIVGMMCVGALQFGVTYLCLYQSFRFLSAPEVLLFTIMTPVFVTLFDDALNRRFSVPAMAAALLAVLGAGVIRYDGITESGYMLGFVLMQIANASFAAGQVGYKQLVKRYSTNIPPFRFFGYFYLGAIIIILTGYLLFGNLSMMPSTTTQWAVLIWLGLGASAIGSFLWNHGGTKVDAGTLAVMNNAVIPVGLVVNILIWNRDADLVRLTLGASIMILGLVVNRFGSKR